MELFNLILDNINIVLTTIIGIAFTAQLIYTLLFFVPAKKYKKSDVKHKIAVICSARNEEKTIGQCLISLKKQKYPDDKYDIYVVAHNCTDNTAKVAEANGAHVVVCNDDNPKHKKVGYALKYLFEYFAENNIEYDFYVRIDADSLLHPDYLDKMNDAFASGVKAARGYNHSKNLTQNIVSGISGLWYIRDARFACQARSFLRTHQMLLGPGMMFSHEIIKSMGGWTQVSTSEDAEFALDCMFKGFKTEYVSEAICYDDQPSTFKDCYNRNVRMGNGLHKLFYTHGLKSFFLFFVKWRWCYLDMFLTLLFIPIAVLCCVWLPLYYGYIMIFNLVVGNMAMFYTILKGIGIALSCAFIIPFILQALLVYVLDRKKINQPFKKVLPSILLFPVFMIVYAFSIFIGVISKPQWKAINRNVKNLDIQLADEPALIESTASETLPNLEPEPTVDNDLNEPRNISPDIEKVAALGTINFVKNPENEQMKKTKKSKTKK